MATGIAAGGQGDGVPGAEEGKLPIPWSAPG